MNRRDSFQSDPGDDSVDDGESADDIDNDTSGDDGKKPPEEEEDNEEVGNQFNFRK